MPITGIKNKLKITFLFLSLAFSLSCVKKEEDLLARRYHQESKRYYQLAVENYQRAIKKGKNLDSLHFELGKLYFNHGFFKEAREHLQRSNFSEAKKFLGICYYRLGEFTDALEVFSKNNVIDDEYRYYWALTCEKLNLYEQALRLYQEIQDATLIKAAAERIGQIEKSLHHIYIQDLDPLVANLISQAPPADKYPQAGALILHCDEKIEITSDNKQISYLHYLVKIINERGKQMFSETQISYDSTFEKVELISARTIKPDGTVVDVGTRHLRDVSLYLNFPLYSNVRAFIISFPEVTEDATIEYKVKIYNNHLINKKDFVLHYPLQSSEPILKANFKLVIPEDRPLNIKIRNPEYNYFGASLEPKVEKKNGFLSYLWSFKDIPQIIPEPQMPALSQINPTIIVSTFRNWQDIYKWWWQLAKDKIQADEMIKEKVRELTKNARSPREKLEAIYNFCAQKIRYVAVEYGQAGYEPHRAVDIFKNKYGDCKDQAILLVTMLKEAGFASWPVLISTKEYYNADKEFPAVLFNHCIACVQLGKELFFLDPTAETCSFGDLPAGDQGRTVLLCKEDSFELLNTPLYPAEHNRLIQELKIKIDKDENIFARKSVTTLGFYDQGQRYWLLYSPPEIIEQTLKQKIQDFSIGSVLVDYKLENLNNLGMPTILRYSFSGPEYLTWAGELRILPQLARIDTSITAQEKRRFPIDYNILESRLTNIEIEIPAQLKIRYLPESVIEENKWFKFTVAYTQKNNTIIYKEEMVDKVTLIPVEEYAGFKKALESLARKVKQRIVLERR